MAHDDQPHDDHPDSITGHDDEPMEVEEQMAMTVNDINQEIARRATRREPSPEYEAEIIALMTCMGSEPKGFGRERKSAMRRVVCEL